MLNLHNILWVVPGIIFIFIYNKRRPETNINLSGWPYVFFLVFMASITWLPSEWIVTHWFSGLNESLQKIIILSVAVILSFIFSLCMRWKFVQKMLPPIYDNFYKKCIEWENEIVLLTLKNGKAYIGVLWKYPETPRSRHESQTISIIPIKSGYRDEKTKQVEWNVNYPEYKTVNHWLDMETIIPRSEIITYGKFSEKTFEHFTINNKEET